MTEDQKKAKEKKFFDNPDQFIDKDDIVVAILKVDSKLMGLVNQVSRHELMIAQSELNFRIHNALQAIEFGKQMKADKDKRIITPK